MERYQIRIDDVWCFLLYMVGVTKETAAVEIDDGAIIVTFGRISTRIQFDELDAVESMSWPWLYGVGVRIAPSKTLGLLGSTQEVVLLTFRKPKPIKIPFPMKFQRVALSVEGQSSFVAAISTQLEERSNHEASRK